MDQPITSNERIESLRRLPWYSVDLPPEVANGVGMIHFDERRMLYTLARDYFTGSGRIIDGGAFLGASSLSLGHGLKERHYERIPMIDAFDWFLIDEYSAQRYLNEGMLFGKEVKTGDNIRFAYEQKISSVAEYIEIHEGNLLDKPWTKGPVEILFSDVSKSWELNDYILRNWMSALIPGTGILIQQDQIQEAHVWVGITMEILWEYFEFLDYTMYSSMVYRLRREIPAQVIEKCLSANITAEEMEYYYLNFLNRFRRIGMGRYKGWTLGMIEVGLVGLYALHVRDFDKALHALKQCEEKFGGIPDTMNRLAPLRPHIPGA